ncbi:MAG: EF-P lysine aminoacylase GenX [Gammaproteobacteria bacterium]|nr:MAG: EF-P lysine aminoacylase GenX [Gammaproteobacteria bacterium]
MASPAVATSRAGLLRRAREFFDARGILEVDTPALSKIPVTDPHIESVSARSAMEPELFLHTSPEYKMKRLLAAGFGDIYQICKVFRDGERGRHHLPEFTLIEWYRLNFGLHDIMHDTIEFVAALLARSGLASSVDLISYEDAFQKTMNFSPRTRDIAELAASMNVDEQLKRAIGDDADAWLDLVLAEKIVPEFATDRLTVIFHYPASQAALARICPDDAVVADRFEVFYGSLELANGFVELTDADEQLTRFERDRLARRRNAAAVHPIDQELINALRAGLPPCAGVAIGFDRLLMLHEDQSDISAVTNFII